MPKKSARSPGQATILLGRHRTTQQQPVGFMASVKPKERPRASLIEDGPDSHTLIVAPTGAGKGRSLIIPNLLHWKGSVIIVDCKGEAARVTARHRREMGQDVFIIDPFAEVTTEGASFDPLCRLKAGGQFIVDDAFACAALLSAGRRSSREAFWDELAELLEAGLMVHVATSEHETDRTLGRVYGLLSRDDMSYQLAVMLDTKVVTHPFAYEQIASFLQHEGEKVRTSVRSTAQQHMKIFASDAVRKAVASTSFDIDKLKAGAPMTIYLVVPPKYLTSHAPLVRLWLATLLDIITDRREAPELPTLLVVDEMHALGPIPVLKQVVTLLRGYGVRAMMVLQNRDQLNDLFPQDATTLVTNCNLVTFGHKNIAMSRDMAAIMGDLTAEQLFRMDADTLAIQRADRPTELATKLDYVKDLRFRGLTDINPFVAKRGR